MTIISLQPGSEGKDTFIDSSSPSNNFNATTFIISGPTSTRKALIEFDLSSIPPSIVNSATLRLHLNSGTATSQTVPIHRGITPWTETGATWDTRDGANAWAGGSGGVAGTDYATTPTDSISVGATGADYDWNVTADVDDIVNNSGTNNGWWLLSSSILKTFSASDFATAGDRPELIIDYIPLSDLEIVTLDYSSIIDTRIFDNAPTFNYGVSTQLSVGENNAAAQIGRSLIKFDLSFLDDNAIILQSYLTLYITLDRSSNARTFRVYRVKRAWTEGSGDGSATADGATWNTYDGTNNWSTAGAFHTDDTEQTDIGSTSFTATEPTDSPKIFSLTGVSKSDIDLGNGWLIKADTETNDMYVFHSSEAVSLPARPTLTIYYYRYLIESTIAGTSSVSATVSASGYMAASISGTSDIEVILISNEFIRANINGTSDLSADLHAIGYMQSVILGTSSVSGDILGKILISTSISGIASVSTHLKGLFYLEADIQGTSSLTAEGSFEGQIRSAILGSSSVSALMWGKAVGVARVIGCNPTPLLYITDGSIRANGQLNLLNFLSEKNGFKLQSWRPQVAQYKEGGRFSNGPLSQGRRLRYRNFDNAIDVFELSAVTRDQDELISFQQELLAWQEAAANYWTSDFSITPVYIAAKSARESNPRYAIIHMISVPELENPYLQPFYNISNASFEAITPRIERGHWLSSPPGVFECVQISSVRQWTVSGWESGS